MTGYGWIRRGVAVSVLGAAFALTSCSEVDNLLEARNPERIDIDDLNDVKLIPVLINSVIGEFQGMYDDPFIWRGSMFTDEQVTGINWEQTARLNLRIVKYDEGDADGMFSALSAARQMADSVSGRLRTLLENPNQDERLALTLAYAGYSYVLMAEAMCEATVNVGDKIYTPDEIMQFAIERFQESMTIAQAASRDDIANLDLVGLSRANLWLGNDAEVMQYAAQVPFDFTFWVEYSDADPDLYNTMYDRVTGNNHALGVAPHFLNGPFGQQDIIATQTDPRIQHTPDWSFGHNALTKLYKPYQSLPYSGYNGETIASGGQPILYEQGTDIKLASGLGAMHDYYEAAGPTGTGPMGSTLDFVNSRRAFGNETPVTLSGDALMAELREQRGRDFYMGGKRLGDLRRWKKQGVGDFFPTGQHPNAEWGDYGDATCYPLPLEEYQGNPNIRK